MKVKFIKFELYMWQLHVTHIITRKTFIGVYSVNPTILKKRKKMSGTIKVKETKEETSFHSLGIWFQKGIEVPSNRRILQTKVDGNGKVDNKGWEWKY